MKNRFALLFLIFAFSVYAAVASNSYVVAESDIPSILVHDLSVNINIPSDTVSLGESVIADVEFYTSDVVANVEVSLNSTEDLLISSESSYDLTVNTVQEVSQQTLSFIVESPGQGEVILTASAMDTEGNIIVTVRRVVYYLASEETVMLGDNGYLSLRLRMLEKSFTDGELTELEYADAREKLLGAGAKESISITTITAATDITISGQILWTDSAGGTHPVRLASVEIRDDEDVGSELVTTVTTDTDGKFSATVDNDDGIGEGGRDVFIRVLTKSDGFNVTGLMGDTWRIDSTPIVDVVDGSSVVIDLTANNTDTNNQAFSIHDALVTAVNYIKAVEGSPYADIDVLFPVSGTSFYSGTDLNILLDDWIDWDVIHHEYGHYVMDTLNIEDNPGGSHNFSDNLGEPSLRGKNAGTRLAWGEGWPTYFAISLQQVQGASSFGIPNVGDLEYTDTIDSSISYSIENQTPSASLGEDNELAVQRILWDLYDLSNDDGDNGVAINHATLWNTIDGANPVRISDAYQAITSGRPPSEVARIGCVFGEHKVAPVPTKPEDDIPAPDAPPKFEWNANGGGPSNLNDKFVVKFYNDTFSELIFTSPEITTATDYTPTATDWTSIKDDAGALINWVVVGTQTNSPETGPYTSCARRMVQSKLDLVITIDTTGSMWDDIDAVKASATDIVEAIADSGADYRIGLVTYRDHPIFPYGDAGDYPARIEQYFTTDTAKIVTSINNIVVGGGADWEEAVYSGALTSLSFPWRDDAEKAIIIMGDAPPHDPEPVTGYTHANVVSAAVAGGVDLPIFPTSGKYLPATASGNSDPIRFYTIVIGSDGNTKASFRRLADDTDGKMFEALSADDVVEAILNALENLLRAPRADSGGPYYIDTTVGKSTVFNASLSYDPDGYIVSYEWDLDGDNVFELSSVTPTTIVDYTTNTASTITLRITDDDGRTDEATTIATSAPLFLPIISSSSSFSVSGPDLIVKRLTFTEDNLELVITNIGNKPVEVGQEFWIDLYINPSPVPTGVNVTWPSVSKEGLVWGVTNDLLPLNPGDTVTLSIGDKYYWPSFSNFSGEFNTGTSLYVQVDSAALSTDYGAVLETHEITGGVYNNIGGPISPLGLLVFGLETDDSELLRISFIERP